MQRARLPVRGAGGTGTPPNPISDTARLAGSRTESGPLFLKGASGVTKKGIFIRAHAAEVVRVAQELAVHM